MLPGRGDFAFGRPFVEAVAQAFELPYVLSNVECAAPLPWPTTRTVEVGGAHVVVYGIAHPDLTLPGCTVKDPAEVLASAPTDDTVVLVLSDLDRGRDLDLVKKAKGIDILVRGDSIEPLGSPFALANGGLVLSSGSRGKQLGVLQVELSAGATSWRDDGAVEARASELDDAVAKLGELATRKAREDDPKKLERLTLQEQFWTKKKEAAEAAVKAATEHIGPGNVARNELRGLGPEVGEHAATKARVDAVKATLTGSSSPAGAPAPSDASKTGFGPFVGTGACTGCHPAETKQWAQTSHSRAWPALVADQRQYDRDCYTCHVTGAFDALGPKDPRALGGLENVGCEACHGAGREHARDPKVAHLVPAPPVSQCVLCHDSRQDGGRFDPATYLPKVKHGASAGAATPAGAKPR